MHVSLSSFTVLGMGDLLVSETRLKFTFVNVINEIKFPNFVSR